MTPEPIHFIGIGGIGMSAIAQALVEKGVKITGSDLNNNQNVQRLKEMGVPIFLGHEGGNLRDAKTVVLSTAVKEDNLEYQAAKAHGLTILHRSEMLAELMNTAAERVCLAGTHGKTTTTTIMACLFEGAGKNPTVINGGIMNAYGTNTKMGDPDCFIVEADESDGSFVRFTPSIAVISNIDAEHMDHYGDFESLMRAFQTFAENTPPEGSVILGLDHPHVRILESRIKHPNILTFGFCDDAQFRAQNLQAHPNGMVFDVLVDGQIYMESVHLKAFGEHNVLNALSSIVAGYVCGFSPEDMSESLANFQGVQRRFTAIGEWNHVTFIDDYAHHPVEIEASLSSARKACRGNVIAILQPHRFSRLKHHFDDFATCCNQASRTIVLPVYPAGESPIPGYDHTTLAGKIPGPVHICEDNETLVGILSDVCAPGDMVVCMGAGSISSIARELPAQLALLQLTTKACA